MLKDKRGQITLFIIIAVLIVVLVVLFFIINPFKISFSAQNSRIIIGNQIAPIRERISVCMNEIAEEDFFYNIGQNAGYYEQISEAYSIEYNDELYYFSLPASLSQVNSEFQTFMKDKGGWEKLDRCVNFIGFGVNVESLNNEEREARLEFKEDRIIIHLDWMLRIKKGIVSVDVKAGKSELMIPFEKIFKLAGAIEDEANAGNIFDDDDLRAPYHQDLLRDVEIIDWQKDPRVGDMWIYKLGTDYKEGKTYIFKFAVQVK